MSQRLETAQDRRGTSLPVARYDFALGYRFELSGSDMTESDPVPAGAYALSVRGGGVLLNVGVDAEAYDTPGSMFVPGGSVFHLLIGTGERIALADDGDAATVYVVPLR